jgi:uncharacterized membrane protein YeaQ/YmgE (transglycosylase-associated protein family)
VGSTGYGVLEAIYAGGSVLGAACGRWLTRRLEIPAILFGTVAIAVASLIVALTSSFVLVLVFVLVRPCSTPSPRSPGILTSSRLRPIG